MISAELLNQVENIGNEMERHGLVDVRVLADLMEGSILEGVQNAENQNKTSQEDVISDARVQDGADDADFNSGSGDVESGLTPDIQRNTAVIGMELSQRLQQTELAMREIGAELDGKENLSEEDKGKMSEASYTVADDLAGLQQEEQQQEIGMEEQIDQQRYLAMKQTEEHIAKIEGREVDEPQTGLMGMLKEFGAQLQQHLNLDVSAPAVTPAEAMPDRELGGDREIG